MYPLRNVLRGLRAFWVGVRWLRLHPSYMAMLFVPWVFGLFFMMGMFTVFVRYDAAIMSWLLFEPGERWWWLALYYLTWAFVYLSSIALVLLLGVLLANILAAPIYDLVSQAVERDLRGGKLTEISMWGSIRLIPDELKKVALILVISLALLVIPGINLLALPVTAFLIGWDFYDYPLARRGWPLRKRWRFVRKDAGAVLGLGLWLMIPFVQFLLMPLAVVGGSMLSLEALSKRDMVEEVYSNQTA